jgi:hypothetical protein
MNCWSPILLLLCRSFLWVFWWSCFPLCVIFLSCPIIFCGLHPRSVLLVLIRLFLWFLCTICVLFHSPAILQCDAHLTFNGSCSQHGLPLHHELSAFLIISGPPGEMCQHGNCHVCSTLKPFKRYKIEESIFYTAVHKISNGVLCSLLSLLVVTDTWMAFQETKNL